MADSVDFAQQGQGLVDLLAAGFAGRGVIDNRREGNAVLIGAGFGVANTFGVTGPTGSDAVLTALDPVMALGPR